MHIVEPGQGRGKKYPFRRPCRVVDKMSRSAASHGKFGVNCIMAKLVDKRICFIWDTFTISVHIDAGERSCLDGIFTEIPHPVKDTVGRFKM